ncbi:histidine--tRNA ligase [Anaerolinea thermophila]|uniref:Histidine--tRNA ligase n=1 Tax=Anaerolinea thermophila (strain DSM 14523 / JCM 11388 / NBRC 100420 / UNI-1) TaxID=926569 RepID=E8N5T4_ANATU|nr:histidine--tRNA ligase [Anaerolinea thermophila]BAJ63798.1 histidyl-tRNA synthetase [Anaerolinea thermophila UNI-1]
MKAIVPSVKGTRDFYPEIMAVRNWLYARIREVSEKFGYQEYEGPFLERVDLYAAKSGEELVNEQSFVFQDRGGDYIALRPELTPTLARMVAQRQNELVYPLRWWSFGPFWRYERPQKGRTREFFQWNIDIIGSQAIEADAELLAVAVEFFKSVGLTSQQVKLLVNNRRLMDVQLENLGIREGQKRDVFRLIDRKEKLPLPEWRQYAFDFGLTQEQLSGLESLLVNESLWETSDELKRVFELLEGMGIREYVEFAPQIIRGLDYYTGTVFEAKDLDGGRSILGGGHYDNLVANVGGEPLPGVGFAMGDVMITLVLEKYGKLPALETAPAQVLVTVFDLERLPQSFALAARLREQGLKVVWYPEAAKLQKQLKFADRAGIRFAVIYGPDEISAGQVALKDLHQRNQELVSVENVGERVRQILAQSERV